jgi:hypothetical protein
MFWVDLSDRILPKLSKDTNDTCILKHDMRVPLKKKMPYLICLPVFISKMKRIILLLLKQLKSLSEYVLL